jgi:phosphoenolpyruvate synthase/pyruvate phosphate dikinase
MRTNLGGKGAGLAEMTRLGVPVPPGFTISTDACRAGVGRLIQMAVQKLRAIKPSIKIGVCGEHAGDPSSIHFFASVGVDYISCSPARLSLAQLAMAQTVWDPAVDAATKSHLPMLEETNPARRKPERTHLSEQQGLPQPYVLRR